jgi:hypothetical protein
MSGGCQIIAQFTLTKSFCFPDVCAAMQFSSWERPAMGWDRLDATCPMLLTYMTQFYDMESTCLTLKAKSNALGIRNLNSFSNWTGLCINFLIADAWCSYQGLSIHSHSNCGKFVRWDIFFILNGLTCTVKWWYCSEHWGHCTVIPSQPVKMYSCVLIMYSYILNMTWKLYHMIWLWKPWTARRGDSHGRKRWRHL